MPFTINQARPTNAELLALAKAATPKPFDYYRKRASYDEADISYAQWIGAVLDNPSSIPFELREVGVLRGVVALKHLDWDTEVYGFPMGKADFLAADVQGSSMAVLLRHKLLEALITHARAKGYRHLVLKADPYDLGAIHAAESLGFRFMDVLSVTSCNFGLYEWNPGAYPQIKLATEAERADVAHVTRSSFTGHANRYSLDWRLPPEGVLKLYEKWMTDGISKEGHVVILARDPETGKPVGCAHGGPCVVIGQSNPVKISRLMLTAVDPNYHARWVTPAVGAVVLGLLKDMWGYNFVETVMHVNNLAAIRVAERFSRHIMAEMGFHLWLD
jgi:RimJ/RimL family protein N-acetyltransferase